MATDSTGAAVVAGIFQGTVDFGGGAFTATATYHEMYLVKYNTLGTHVWSQHLAGTDYVWPTDLAIDPSGDFAVVGRFEGTVDLGGGPLTSATVGEEDVFVAKYKADGTYVWSRSFGPAWWGGATYWGYPGERVTVDGSGHVVIAGGFLGTVDFGGGPLTNAGTKDHASDIFIAKYAAADGSHLWSNRYGDPLVAEFVGGLAVDPPGEIVAVGRMTYPVDLGGGLLEGPAGEVIFLAKFSASGGHIWSQRFNSGLAPGVAVGPSGEIAFTGRGAGDFGGGVLANGLLIATYDSTGAHLWSNTYPAEGLSPGGFLPHSPSRDVAFDPSGNVMITGSFVGTADFGGSPMTSHAIQINDGYVCSFYYSLPEITVPCWVSDGDIFVAKYTGAGVHVWSRGYWGGDDTVIENESQWWDEFDDIYGRSNDGAASVATDGAGSVFVAGSFGGAIDIDGHHVVSDGWNDMLLLKLASAPSADCLCEVQNIFPGGVVANLRLGGKPTMAKSLGAEFAAVDNQGSNSCPDENPGTLTAQADVNFLVVDEAGNELVNANETITCINGVDNPTKFVVVFGPENCGPLGFTTGLHDITTTVSGDAGFNQRTQKIRCRP
jgi:hypothetical protein